MSRTIRSINRTRRPRVYRRQECKYVNGEQGLGEVDEQHLRVKPAELRAWIEFCGGLEPEPFDEWQETEDTINAAEYYGETYNERVKREVWSR